VTSENVVLFADVVVVVVVWDSPKNQLRSVLETEVMLHSGYFYFLLHFCKWLQKYVIDPVLWIFTGYTTLGGRQKRSKCVDVFEREILPTDSSGKKKLHDERPFEESAQIVTVWFKAAYCDTIGIDVIPVYGKLQENSGILNKICAIS
jgi:hypothetical protein